MTINLSDFVNQFVKVKLRNGSIYYGEIAIKNISGHYPTIYIFSPKDSTIKQWYSSSGISYDTRPLIFGHMTNHDIIEIERVKESTTNPKPSSFLDWFSSEYGQYSFRSEAFIADCEIKDEKLLKLTMFKWLQAAYEAGTEQKVEQQP